MIHSEASLAGDWLASTSADSSGPSNDAIEDESLGLVYSTRIQLAANSILVGSQHVLLSPGMAVRAEVKTGRRKVIEYLLSSLRQYLDESLVER